MKQLFQSLKDGSTTIEEIPLPNCNRECVLVETSRSLVSVGTERMIVNFGKSNILKKATTQKDKVQQVIQKTKSDGYLETYQAVKSKLDQAVPLGYSNVGRVFKTRSNDFSIGDRVVSNGAHAEIIQAQKNLCAKIPDNVSDDEASFTVVGAIALNAVRLAKLELGEKVAVIGLGLIGLLTSQILKAQGCDVVGFDHDDDRIKIAQDFGIEAINSKQPLSIEEKIQDIYSSEGVDAVIIAASTNSNGPIEAAAKICRKRGRVILVGVAGLNLSRNEFYNKEISFQVSCSYGPGRYDDNYEEKGQDYPIGYVRWTVKRNFETILKLISNGDLNVKPLMTHEFHFNSASLAMKLLSSKESALGILFKYDLDHNSVPKKIKFSETIQLKELNLGDENFRVGVLGAGNYASRVLVPAFSKSKLCTVVSPGAINAFNVGKRFGFEQVSSNEKKIFEDNNINLVVIATRHNNHADYVVKSLKNGKHVFCEKPLCLSMDELQVIENVYKSNSNLKLVVGFNRRFSPLTIKAKELLGNSNAPKHINITVNAGAIDKKHWTQDPKIGGGRIIGEVCHFVDLAKHFCDSKIINFSCSKLNPCKDNLPIPDSLVINLTFDCGSIATINYLSNGHKAYPKERIDIFSNGKILQIDNFKTLKGWGFSGFKQLNLWRQDKGVKNLVNNFLLNIKSDKGNCIPVNDIFEVTRTTINISESIKL